MESTRRDHETGSSFRREIDAIEPPGPDYRAVVRRSRWLGARRSGAAVLFAGMTAMAVWLAVGVWAGGPGSEGTSTSGGGGFQPAAQATPEEGWSRHRNEEHGYSVAYSSDWQETDASTLSAVVEPEPILALATGALAPGGDCGPTAALEGLGPEDAAIFLGEVTGGDPTKFAERPATIGPSHFTELTMIECYVEPVRLFSFRDQGRLFTAVVAPGDSLSPERKDEVWRILNSLQFDAVP